MTIAKLVTLLSYYLKVWLVFKESTKQTKSILVASEHIKSANSTRFQPPKNENYQSWWKYTFLYIDKDFL